MPATNTATTTETKQTAEQIPQPKEPTKGFDPDSIRAFLKKPRTCFLMQEVSGAFFVLMAGLEPARRKARDFKSPVSAIPPHQRHG